MRFVVHYAQLYISVGFDIFNMIKLEKAFFQIFSSSMLWCVFLLSLTGCGPNLSRPGYHPSTPAPTKSPMQVFQEAQADVLSKLKFKFEYLGFEPLEGVAQEVMRVLYQYPPERIGGKGPILALHVNDLIDKEWKKYSGLKKVGNHDLECARDYRELCPLGWTDLGDGVSCESPASMYENELCRVVKFGDLPPLQKSSRAYECGKSVYPCLNACKHRDYTAVCPQGWKRREGEVCVAGKDYSVPCVHRYDFKDHSVRLKKKFEAICKVEWPCATSTVLP